jgi:pimeloyl-ACP methyl ester carboxylesterase
MEIGNVSVVLVHGAWEDGSVWSKVIERLNRRGVRAMAVSLTLNSLHEDVAALDRALERIDGPVVLAGHAYGGAVIGSARAENVKALVYVAALAPDAGETVGDLFYRGEPHPQAPKLAPDRHGLIWVPEEAFANAIAQDASPQELTVLNAVQRPISAACIGEATERPLWKERPSWYLVAEQDRMISADTQHFLATRMNAHVHSYPVDHTPMIAAPDTVTDVIVEAAQSIAAH